MARVLDSFVRQESQGERFDSRTKQVIQDDGTGTHLKVESGCTGIGSYGWD